MESPHQRTTGGRRTRLSQRAVRSETLAIELALRPDAAPQSLEETVREVNQFALQQPGVVGCGYLIDDPQQTLSTGEWEFQGIAFETDEFREQCRQLASKAISSQSVTVIRDDRIKNVFLRAYPISAASGRTDVWVAAVAETEQPNRATDALDVLALRIRLTHCERQTRIRDEELLATAAMIELVTSIEAARNLQDAATRLVQQLADHLGARQVALGWRHANARGCQLLAVSGQSSAAATSAAEAMQTLCDEALVRGEITCWPARHYENRHTALAHQAFLQHSPDSAIISCPLPDAQESVANESECGTIVCTFSTERAASESVERFLKAAAPHLASSLRIVDRATEASLKRWRRNLQRAWRHGWLRFAAGAVLVGSLILSMPIPYRVACGCRIEPVSRQVSIAPFDGLVEQGFVSAGQTVQAGQLLATMDTRELDWELTGLSAEREQAIRERDAGLVAGEAAAMQTAQLQIERIDAKRKLLEYRLQHRDLRAAVTGVVLSGGEERLENTPVTQGRPLFEIAPLHQLRVEIDIPADEINHIQPGQEVEILLQGQWNEPLQARIQRIAPQSKIRDGQNVFIAEVTIDNSEHQYHPGQFGDARIKTSSRSLAWNLFHRPVERTWKALW